MGIDTWEVEICDEFIPELSQLARAVRVELLAYAGRLGEFGPNLGRPTVDTLVGSTFSNMKELRFNADNGVWRVAFAFDPKRKAIVLVAGNKAGLWDKAEKKFYRELIRTADERFEAHLARLKKKDADRQSNKRS